MYKQEIIEENTSLDVQTLKLKSENEETNQNQHVEPKIVIKVENESYEDQNLKSEIAVQVFQSLTKR